MGFRPHRRLDMSQFSLSSDGGPNGSNHPS